MGTLLKKTPQEIEAYATEKGITVEEATGQLEAEARTALETRATEEGVSVEELIAEEEELAGLVEKYGGDPIKMAKALKSSAQEATKLIERHKALEKEKEDLTTRLDTSKKPPEDFRKGLTEHIKTKFPTLDDDVVEALVETNINTASVLRYEYTLDKANDKLAIEKEGIKSDPMYKRFKDEIDKLIDSQPIQMKLSPGLVRRCRDLVIGQHTEELIKEAKENPKEPPEEKEIEGVLPGGPKTKVTPIETSKLTKLTAEQAKQANEMGLAPESYLAILAKRKKIAKENNMPEPKLITEPVRKK